MVVCRARLQICLTEIFGGHLLEEHTSDWAHNSSQKSEVEIVTIDCDLARYIAI